MVRIPSLEYNLSHPHPRNRLFLVITVIIFLLAIPVLVIVNIVTLGFEVVPSLQSQYQPNDTMLEGRWGTRRLPPLLRPKRPRCEPKDFGRGDVFRLSASLFDYTVLSTWDTSEVEKASRVPEQKRVEYRNQSFANCYVKSFGYEYDWLDRTLSINPYVECPGSPGYPIYVTMQTTMTFSFELIKSYIGRYFGIGDGMQNFTQNANPSNYRKLALVALDLISTDVLQVFYKYPLSNPALKLSITYNYDPNTGIWSDIASYLVYANGTQPPEFPEEGKVYLPPIENLVNVAVDAVNLDLGYRQRSNIFINATRVGRVIHSIPPPNGTDPANWAGGSQSFFYGILPPTYRSWAEMLLNGLPIKLGTATAIPDESVMVTTYLCPIYQLKPMSSLLSSVFVGSATMTLLVWGFWVGFMAFIAKRIAEPRIHCSCSYCERKREKEEEGRRREAGGDKVEPGPEKAGASARLTALAGVVKRTNTTSTTRDVESSNPESLSYDTAPQHGRPTSTKHASDLSGLMEGEKKE